MGKIGQLSATREKSKNGVKLLLSMFVFGDALSPLHFTKNNASKVGMIGAKYAMQPSGAGYKVSSQNYWHKQSKGENEVK